jgi:hypothetical protein
MPCPFRTKYFLKETSIELINKIDSYEFYWDDVRILTGRVVPMIIPEDSILSKLVWIKLGSDRSRKDVVAMLRIQTNLDNEYLETTAEKLDVAKILKELRMIAESYNPNIIL